MLDEEQPYCLDSSEDYTSMCTDVSAMLADAILAFPYCAPTIQIHWTLAYLNSFMRTPRLSEQPASIVM